MFGTNILPLHSTVCDVLLNKSCGESAHSLMFYRFDFTTWVLQQHFYMTPISGNHSVCDKSMLYINKSHHVMTARSPQIIAIRLINPLIFPFFLSTVCSQQMAFDKFVWQKRAFISTAALNGWNTS